MIHRLLLIIMLWTVLGTVEQNDRLENYGEDTIKNYWARSTKIAEEVLK